MERAGWVYERCWEDDPHIDATREWPEHGISARVYDDFFDDPQLVLTVERDDANVEYVMEWPRVDGSSTDTAICIMQAVEAFVAAATGSAEGAVGDD